MESKIWSNKTKVQSTQSTEFGIQYSKNFKPAAPVFKKVKNRKMSDAYVIRRGFSSSRVLPGIRAGEHQLPHRMQLLRHYFLAGCRRQTTTTEQHGEREREREKRIVCLACLRKDVKQKILPCARQWHRKPVSWPAQQSKFNRSPSTSHQHAITRLKATGYQFCAITVGK